jgi:hypothetical protein
MTWLDGPPCPDSGPALLARIAALQRPATRDRIRWRWYLDWWSRRPELTWRI